MQNQTHGIGVSSIMSIGLLLQEEKKKHLTCDTAF